MRDKRWSSRSVLLGTWLLGVSMAGSVFLVVDVTLGTLAAAGSLTMLLIAIAVAWILPMVAAGLNRNRVGSAQADSKLNAD